jgi:hypothetical protein
VLDGLKQFVRAVQDANASKLELRLVRANFAAVVEEQQYRRREAETNLIQATRIIEKLLPPRDAVELDWPRDGHERRVMEARQFLAELQGYVSSS